MKNSIEEHVSSEKPGLPEQFFVVFVLLLSNGAFLNLLSSQDGNNRIVAGSVLMQMLWASLYTGILLLLVRHCKGFTRRLMCDPWLFVLLSLAFLSAAWSSDPALTIKRSLGLLGTYLLALYLVMRYDIRKQLTLIACALGFTMLLSVPFGVFGIGDCGPDVNGWCGIYPHKNTLGMMATLAAIVFILRAKVVPEHKWSMRLLAGISLCLLWLSDSKTSLLALFGTLLVFPYTRLVRRNVWRAALGTACVLTAGAMCVYWGITHLHSVTDAFGRDATLSGRLDLWIFSVVMALQRPWLGYGYGAFWLDRDGPSARVMTAMGKWHAFYAHNGVLELWLDLGLVSVAAFLIGFVFCVVRTIIMIRQRKGPESVWPLAFLVFVFITNLAESTVLAPDNMLWLLYVAVVFLVSPVFRNMSAPYRVIKS